MTFFVSEVIRN